jgi:hypothetical protein
MGRSVRLLCGLTIVLWASGAGAVSVISPSSKLPFDSPEAWAMKYFTTASLLTGLGVPDRIRLGALRLGLEAGWIPFVSEHESRVGFGGTKQEDLNQLPVFGRLRLTVGLPWRVAFTVGYVPPIEISGVTANLLSFALGRPLYAGRAFRVGLRVYGQIGSVRGAFTCSRDEVAAGPDPERNPYGCHAHSTDSLESRYVGFELSSGLPIRRAHGLMPYASVAANYLNMQFNVRARYADIVDYSIEKSDGWTFSTTLGLSYPVWRGLSVAMEAFYSPLTVHRAGEEAGVDRLFNIRGLIEFRVF